MTSQWLNNTEIVVGFVLRGKLDPHAVNPDDLHPPYNEIIPTVRDADTLNEAKENVIAKHGYSLYRDSVAASEEVNSGTTPLNWLKLLEQSASRFKSGVDLEKVGRDLQDGKEVDLGRILQYTSQIELGYRAMTPLSQVEPEKNSLIKTGYAPVDEWFGGIPKAGLTLIAGATGIGKTFIALRIALCMIRKYPKKKVAIFSLEMLMSQLVARYLTMDKKMTLKDRERILASESSYTMSEVYAVAARTAATEDLGMIVIDFADLLVEGEQSEAVMGKIYRAASILAKQTKVPVVLVAQLNRENYKGGVPKIHHVRYSGMAEMMSSLILLLYNPNMILADFSNKEASTMLPPVQGKGYIIGGKARFGFKKGTPGAVQVDWDGGAGWGDTVYGQYIPLIGV